MKETIFDLEGNDLLPGLNRMHVISWQERNDNQPKSSPDESAVDKVFDTDLLIGHFITGYDLPALKKLFNKEPGKDVIIADTLILSWYLDPERVKYGLESYGETFGIEKPKIKDWENLSYLDYQFRCERDVKINTRQWKRIRAKLVALYGTDDEGNLSKEALRLIKYLHFKAKTAFETEQHGIRLDYKKAKSMSDKLTLLKEAKFDELSKAMPKHTLTKRVIKPKNIYKKDGSLSEAGKRWFKHLEGAKLPKDTVGPINVVDGYEDGNPGSNLQIKEWLYSLGWKPSTFKFSRNKVTGEEKLIPQVRDKGELCESVKELSSKDPAIEQLDGLTVLTHRISIFDGYLKAAEYRDGEYWVRSRIDGLTNTFRFKHRAPLVNLPGVDKLYGEDIRSCLLAPSDDHVVCGADMVSLNFGGL